MKWSLDPATATPEESDEFEYRLEAVSLTLAHGSTEAARRLTLLYPERRASTGTLRRWVRDYARANAEDLARVAEAESGIWN